MSGPAVSSMLAPSGFFVLRTPLLPFATLTAVAVEQNPRARLIAVLARPEVREAIYLASPRMEAAIDRWLADPDGDETRRLQPVLASYALRAATRPTPFGLFAGWTTGTVGQRGSPTSLQLEARSHYRRHSRLGMDFLVELAGAVGRDREQRRALPHRPNSSLHTVAGRLHFAESRHQSGRRSYNLVAVEATPYLTETLERAGHSGSGAGAALDELADALVDGEITAGDARAYVDELVDRQVLVADLGPPVTGPEPGPYLAARLAALPAAVPLARPLEEVSLALAALDDGGVGGADHRPPAERYAAVAATLRELPDGPPAAGFQVDLEKPAQEAILGGDVVAVIATGIEILHRLGPRGDDTGLVRFREEFVARYDTRAVPLAEALDEEVGIGFERIESPAAEAPDLLADIPFTPMPGTGAGEGRWTRRDAALLRRLGTVWRDRPPELELSPADIAELEPFDGGPPSPLPGALAAVARVAARSDADLAAGRFRVLLRYVAGPSGAELLGRFCGADKALRVAVEAHLRAEEARQPDAVFAEIVHLPEGRAGNVVGRPVLRRYEIPYLGQSGAPPDAQIPVSDLLVAVRDERIVLESRSLGVEVIPRLTSAHLHNRPGPPIYRFLGRLQYQGVASELGWDWGSLADAPFLPRVVAGAVVLAPAQWCLVGRPLAMLRAGGPDRTGALAAWRAEWGVPRFVALVDEEDEFVVDLDDELAVDALTHQLRSRDRAVLVEMFPGPDELCVTGPEGGFVHDLVVPFLTDPPPPESAPTGSSGTGREGPRTFPPGSEWLYAKLYCGPATADRVLVDAVASVAEQARASGAADAWFFVRDADPDPHLRVRFGGRPDRLQGEVLPALEVAAAGLLRDGLIWNLQLGTYEREVERYGGHDAIELTEEIFAADTQAVMEILAGPARHLVPDLRWRAALAGVAGLVDDLGLNPDQQRRLAAESRAAYGAEFGVDGRFQRAVSKRFRQERPGLEALLAATPAGRPRRRLDPGLRAVLEALDRRSARIRPVMAELRSLAAAGALSVTLDDLAGSLAHMHVNRLLRAAPRAQELVVYEFLDRLWAARAVRAGNGIPDRGA